MTDVFDDLTMPAGPRVFSIAEARLRATETLEHLSVLGADGYVVKGWSHLLAGWWRLGKSELAAAMVLPWLRAGLRVLWLTEEPDSLWADRADMFEEIYAPVPWEQLTLVDAHSAAPDALLDYAVSVESDVVIVDTIREVCGITAMKDDEAVHRALSPWLRRLRDGKRTLLFLAQHRKAGGENGERILGSVELPAKFDVALELEAVPEHPQRRRLTVRRRRAQVQPLVYEMDDDERLFVIPDARSRSRLETEAAVLFAVNESPEPLPTADVRRLVVPAPSRPTLKRTLKALADDGRILRDPPITEDAARRTVTWRRNVGAQMDLAHGNLAQNSLPPIGEFREPDGVEPDLAPNTPNTAAPREPLEAWL